MNLKCFYGFAIMLSIQVTTLTCQQIIVGPDDISAVRGAMITLRCTAEYTPNSIVYWTRVGSYRIYSYDGNGGNIIPTPPPGNWKYEVSLAGELRGVFDLSINSVEWSDGGSYECMIIHSVSNTEDRAEADVVIIELPYITQSPVYPLDGDTAEFVCAITFGTPVKNWTDIGREMFPQMAVRYQGAELLDGEYREAVGVPNVVWSQISETHNMTVGWEDDGRAISCEVYIEKPYLQPQPTTYPISVLFGVRDMTFEPQKDEYFMNEAITCKVLGQPDPEIIWEPLHDPSLGVVLSDRLQLGGALLGDNRWRCTANNTVDGNVITINGEIQFEVLMTTTTTTTTAVPTTDDGSKSSKLLPSVSLLFLTLAIFSHL